MARPRIQLNEILKGVLQNDNVYFQPPSNIVMKYPCIVYKRDDENATYADDKPYVTSKRYQVMVIDPDPDSLIPDRVALLPLTKFDRSYSSDELNHSLFDVFF